MTRDGQEEKSSAARASHFDPKPLVGLLIEELVRLRRAQNVPIKPVRTLRRFVFNAVEERAIVGRPGDTGDTFESLGKRGPSTQIFDLKQVLTKTRGIRRIGEQVVVFTHFEGIQSKKRMAFRKSDQVEQKLFSRAGRLAPPPMDHILLSFLRPREIKIPAKAGRYGNVRLLDAPSLAW